MKAGLRRIVGMVIGFAGLGFGAGPGAGAAAACEDLRRVPGAPVVAISDGDTVTLSDGTIVRLIGTQAPKLALGREGFVDWPLSHEAREHMAGLVADAGPVVLGFGGEEIDRYERTLAHLFVTDADGREVWVQEAMVRAGFARVYSFPDNRACLAPLMAAERAARADRLGIWGNGYYSVRTADRPAALLERVGHYELVEGRVLLADRSGGRVYLNFGRHWKEDFTVVIEARALALFAEDGDDPLALEGAVVRVRGWVDERDGPRIEVTHPEQIEVIG